MSFLALALAMQAPPAVAASPAAPTVQQAFEEAVKAIDAGQIDAGVLAYRALEARLAKSGSKSLPLVRLRLGSALLAQGKDEEGAALLRAGLAGWTGPDPSGERASAFLDLAGAAERALDYAAARRDYAAARDLLPAESFAGMRLGALAGIARTAMFDDAPAAVAAADEALRVAVADAKTDKPMHAQVLNLRGRALLNGGDTAAARAALKQALALLGGLTARIDRADLAARSDLAIAALLAGDEDDARKYLAWTGAGTEDDGNLVSVDAPLPACGDADGLRADDVAIVEFGIGDDGAVSRVAPIYASRPGVGLPFARAVSGWSWRPEQVAKIKPFFRTFTRLELRCSAKVDRPSPLALVEEDRTRWLATKQVAPIPSRGVPATAVLATARQRLAAAPSGTGADALPTLPALVALVDSPLAPVDESRAAIDRAVAIAAAADAPPIVRAELGLRAARLRSGNRGGANVRRASFEREVQAAIADPKIATDPRALALLRLELADMLQARRDQRQAEVLRAVADEERLGRDSLRTGALVRLAAAEAEGGRIDAAREAFTRSGLTEQQCALVDATPALKSASTVGGFPDEAMAWRFEGWVQMELDVTADGSTANVRPVIAYPPFVFGKAAGNVLKRARFTQSYRPAGSLGCGGMSQRIRFNIPG